MSTELTPLPERPPLPPDSPGLNYAHEMIDKLECLAAFCPSGTLAENVSRSLVACADSIRFEIEYWKK